MSSFREEIQHLARDEKTLENDLLDKIAEAILQGVKEQIREDASSAKFSIRNGKRVVSGCFDLNYDVRLKRRDFPFFIRKVDRTRSLYRSERNLLKQYRIAEKSVRYKNIFFKQIDEKLLAFTEVPYIEGDQDHMEIETFEKHIFISEQEKLLRSKLTELASKDDITLKFFFLVSVFAKHRDNPIETKIFETEDLRIRQEKGFLTYDTVLYQYEFEF